MKLAILDLGTNTFNLIIRDTRTDRVLYNDKLPVKLGKDGLETGSITSDAFARGLKALDAYTEVIREHKADETYAIATSAVRSTTNGQEFVEQAAEQFGIRINIIDGLTEAELIHRGVKEAVELSEDISLIMDIGGGSTEFILASSGGIHWKGSFDIGSSRLLDHFQPSDPITSDERLRVQEFLAENLPELVAACDEFPPQLLIGSSGSFETLADMIIAAYPGPKPQDAGSGFEFDLLHYRQIADKMFNNTLQQRLHTPGMLPMRADMIVMACLQVNFVLRALNLKKMKLSTFAVKEGAYYSIKENSAQWLKSLL